MNSFSAATRIAWRSLPESLGWLPAVVRLIGVPILTTLFYLAIASGGGQAPVSEGDVVAAALGAGSVSASVAVAVLIAGDRFNGTLPYLLIAARGRATAWAGRFSVVVGIGIATGSLGMVLPLIFVSQPGTELRLGAIAIVLVATAPASIGIGYVLGAISLSLRDSLLLANLAEYLLPLFCGVVTPVALMPDVVAWVAKTLPLTHILEAGRIGAADGITLPFGLAIVTGLAVGACWALAGWGAWWYFDRRVRIMGTADSLAIG